MLPNDTTRMLTRPETLASKTARFESGHGSFYLTVSFLEEKPVELFIQVSKPKPNLTKEHLDSHVCFKAWAEALARSISLGLQRGVSAGEYIQQLTAISCGHTHMQEGGSLLSVPDAIAYGLKEILAHTIKP